MPESRDYTLYAGPLGPYRDVRAVDISAADYERAGGFTVQVTAAGSLTYRTLLGDADETTEGLSAGDSITGPGGIPVMIRAVRSSSTITGILAGIL